MDSNILIHLRTQLDHFSNIEKKIAAVILDDPKAFTGLTLSEMAGKSGVSQGSIINFSRKYAGGGYPNLKLKVSASLHASKPQPLSVVESGDSIKEALNKNVLSHARAFEITSQINSEKSLQQAAEHILFPPRDHIGKFSSAGIFCPQPAHDDNSRTIPRGGIIMLKKIAILLLILSIACMPAGLCGEINLSPTAVPESPPEKDMLPPLSQSPLLEGIPFNIQCASVILVEQDTGQIIFEMNADSPRPVASVTKVMTILLTLEMLESGRLSPDTLITVSEDAAGMGGSQVLLDVGEKQTISSLLKSMIVGSANDAAVALAEAMYGSEEICADQMNKRAAELGMANTHFVNCTGLPADGQHTTARDIAIMSREMFSHPLYYEYSGIWLENFDHGDGRVTQLTNTNKLIRLYDGCDGGKTGSTNEAGYCISATAERGGMRLVAVVLGAESSTERFDIAKEMFDYGFANYRLYPVAQSGVRVKGMLPVTGGTSPGVSLMLNGDLTLLVLKGSEQDIRLSPNLPESIPAPVRKGQTAGSVSIITEGRTVVEIPLITCESIDAKGLMPNLSRLIDRWLDSSSENSA